MSSAAAAQRSTILPSRQRQTFRVRRRTPLCGLSMTLVETRQRERLGDKPKRFTVNISAKPSRKLAAALGYSRSSHSACFSIRTMPSLGGSRKAARRDGFHLLFQLLGQVTHDVLDLVVAATLYGMLRAEHGVNGHPQ